MAFYEHHIGFPLREEPRSLPLCLIVPMASYGTRSCPSFMATTSEDDGLIGAGFRCLDVRLGRASMCSYITRTRWKVSGHQFQDQHKVDVDKDVRAQIRSHPTFLTPPGHENGVTGKAR